MSSEKLNQIPVNTVENLDQESRGGCGNDCENCPCSQAKMGFRKRLDFVKSLEEKGVPLPDLDPALEVKLESSHKSV